jgi:hypothetical protein
MALYTLRDYAIANGSEHRMGSYHFRKDLANSLFAMGMIYKQVKKPGDAWARGYYGMPKDFEGIGCGIDFKKLKIPGQPDPVPEPEDKSN